MRSMPQGKSWMQMRQVEKQGNDRKYSYVQMIQGTERRGRSCKEIKKIGSGYRSAVK